MNPGVLGLFPTNTLSPSRPRALHDTPTDAL